MSSSKRPSHCLTVEASEPGLAVLVIDAADNIVGRVADDEERLKLDLPHGLYTIRSSRSGAFAEQVIRLDHSQTLKAEPPPVFSAATIPGAETTREYYTYPAWDASQQLTGDEQAWDGPADAQLLLFVRAVHKDAYDGKDQLASLSLRTLDGRSLSEFTNDARRDENYGWSAYSARLSHGLLIVEDLGELPRQIPVPLIRGWQTQIYVIYHQRLLWDDMRLTLVPENEVNTRNDRSPYDKDANDVSSTVDMDAGLLALQNDTPSVAPQLIDTFIYSKFRNPILGLLGGYLMLFQYQRKKAAEGSDFKPDTEQIRTVLNNLNNLLPGSADVAALRLLAKDWVTPPKLDPVRYVPLFRSGSKILLREAASDDELLQEGSLLDEVSTSLYGDTAWTTWKPVPLGRSEAKEQAGAALKPSWVEQAVVDTITAAEYREVDLAPEDLVRQIGVSTYAVRRAIESLMARAPSQQLPSHVQHWILRQISGEVKNTLASTLGEQFEESLTRMISDKVSAEKQVLKPSWQKTYSLLKKILSQFADPCVGKISADTMLAEIIRPDEELGRFFASKMISRRFRDYNISLSEKELSPARTVRDVADMMVRKPSE